MSVCLCVWVGRGSVSVCPSVRVPVCACLSVSKLICACPSESESVCLHVRFTVIYPGPLEQSAPRAGKLVGPNHHSWLLHRRTNQKTDSDTQSHCSSLLPKKCSESCQIVLQFRHHSSQSCLTVPTVKNNNPRLPIIPGVGPTDKRKLETIHHRRSQ